MTTYLAIPLHSRKRQKNTLVLIGLSAHSNILKVTLLAILLFNFAWFWWGSQPPHVWRAGCGALLAPTVATPLQLCMCIHIVDQFESFASSVVNVRCRRSAKPSLQALPFAVLSPDCVWPTTKDGWRRSLLKRLIIPHWVIGNTCVHFNYYTVQRHG